MLVAMRDSTSSWAENLRKEVFEYWQSNYSHWDPGFQVWYGTVDSAKDVLILGIHGGGESAFNNHRTRFEAGDFSLDSEHHHLTPNYDLAKATRKVVPRDLIERSVKPNLNFFRAPNQSEWTNGLPEETRREIEAYCFDKIEEIVDRIKPKLVITEGTASVFDKLRSAWDLSTVSVIKHQVGDTLKERLVTVSENEDIGMTGLKHPSSGRGLGSK